MVKEEEVAVKEEGYWEAAKEEGYWEAKEGSWQAASLTASAEVWQPKPKLLPRWKLAEAARMHTQPKQKPKPSDTDEHPRNVKARSASDRAEFRVHGASAAVDDPSLPWDVRGPPGPKDGGPTTWKGQRYRENSGRWANSGGRHKEKYDLYRKKKYAGLAGRDLPYWHPLTQDGYWARKAHEEGIMAPWQEKEL